MSRSNNDELKSPATRYFEWSSENRCFTYYDKEKKEKVKVSLPFRFLVLDQLVTIKGFSDENQSGFWSNEIREFELKTAILDVRTKKGLEASGTYEQLASVVGVKFAKSVYIAYYNDLKELVIGNISMYGASVGSWIEFCKNNKVMEIGVQVKSSLEGKKGKTVFYSPVFEKLDITPETNEKAIALDKELQEYLKLYFAKGASFKDVLDNEPIPTAESFESPKKEERVSMQDKLEAKAGRGAIKEAQKEANIEDEVDDLPF